MSLRSVKEAYGRGEMDKPRFIEEMHAQHRLLFEYAELVKDTDISRIEISDDQVVMTTRASGLKFIVDPEDRRVAPLEILNFGRYEGDEGEMLLALVKDGDVVFDVGANIGYYAMRLARERRDTRVFAFEPIPRTFSYLSRHLALNGVGNVFPQNLGLGKEPGELVFYYYPEGSGNASIANLTGRADVQRVTSALTTLDAFAREQGTRVDVVKCDVEGAELFVFQGAAETLRRDRPALFAEILRKWSRPFGYHPNDLLDYLRGFGYRCFVVAPGPRLAPFGRVDDATVETNYIFLDPERHARIIERHRT